MALKDLETRQVARRELKGMLAGYLHGKAGRIDINDMGDYLFDRMARVPERPAERRIQAGLRPGYPSPPSTRTRGRRRTDGMRGMFHDGGSRVHEPMRMLRKTRLRRLCSSERIRRTNLLPMLGR